MIDRGHNSFLTKLMPDFWWFRDSHYMVGDKLRIIGTIFISERYSPEDIVGYVNGEQFPVSDPIPSDYGDQKFWFASEERKFGLTMDVPITSSTKSIDACFIPKGQDPKLWVSGQYIDWAEMEPTPPLINIERVSGKGATNYNYYNNGRTDFLRFTNLAKENDIDITEPDVTVLDWGCGCGRLTRHLIAEAGLPQNIFGIDIDPDNIAWSAENLTQGSFSTVELYPPTPFEDSSFDLVIANSVLSHLQYQTTHDWLAEVARLLKPNGIALLSYHGNMSLATALGKSADFAHRVYDEGFNSDLAARELEGFVADPEYYRQTFMTDKRASEIFREHLDLKEVHTGMVSRYQNVAVLKKKKARKTRKAPPR